ncbi:flagellar basal body P-ring formation protein FlgA [Roseateles sp. DAIF2]|uniref:flagellar basal body P-ring formation chaperone FlgA n=1 Tax=Roseateles sp. DAIF2 TaxID=2714952 RepID=UPI0018A2FF49|nr:flagellar basal body P-ring formation chaperone FlgA [Roseateles sp. DAIF2]QPF74683.1 flagellar basal body P-ring formation protein FlgA [Roseateles sp. DAIF2]
MPAWAGGSVLQLRDQAGMDARHAMLAVNDLLVAPLEGAMSACATELHPVDPRSSGLGRLWVERRLRACGVKRWRWAGNLRTRLQLEGERGPYASAREAVEATLTKAYGGVDRVTPGWIDMRSGAQKIEDVEDDPELSYRVSLPPQHAGGMPAQAVLQLETYRGGRLLRRDALPVRLHRMASVWLATRAVAPGEALDPSAFERREIDVAGLPETVDAAAPWADGWRARTRIAEGAPLLRSGMQLLPGVSRGRSVTAVAAAGQVRLTLPGTALQDGQSGAWVRVRLAGQRETVMAQVESSGHVEVK